MPRKLLWGLRLRLMIEEYLVEMIMIFVIIDFEAGVINLLHTLVFVQSPTKYTI